jgi:hypothetical protein
MKKILFFCLFALNTPAQQLWVDIVPDFNEIGAESLQPPFTAGADYAEEILLNSKAWVQFSEIQPGSKWCLLARSTETTQGGAVIHLRPDYMSVSVGQWSANSPSLIPLNDNTLAVFSGIGEVESLLIELIVSGAEVLKDWEPRDISIEWTVVSGGCLL